MDTSGEYLYYQYQERFGNVAAKTAWAARKRMFGHIMRLAKPTRDTAVLDVGVTSFKREDCNFFERLYPYPGKITAVGLGDSAYLEKDYPGLKFIKINSDKLPFTDKSFDLVVSFAAVEHVGGREEQRRFIQELCRVGRRCLITCPYRWFPVEFHTLLPFVHWLPSPYFRKACRLVGRDFFAEEKNLSFPSRKDIVSFSRQAPKSG